MTVLLDQAELLGRYEELVGKEKDGHNMKITLESTTKTVTFNGIPARIWEGHTESGIPVLHAYITRVGVHKDHDCTQFEAELKEQRAPSPEIEAIPMRMIL